MSQRKLWLLLCALATAAYAPKSFVSAGSSDTLSSYKAGNAGLTALQQQGRDTWYFWTGGDTDAQGNVVGDQELWRILAVRSHGTVDLLQAIDSRYRPNRFKLFGVINDPDCTQASAPDANGLWLDTCLQQNTPEPIGQPVGIVGLRRFNNPHFDPKAWDLKKYLADPSKVEPPYLIGMACSFCHVGFNPLHPPSDPENPTWKNLNAGIGNQYLREQTFHTAKYPAARDLTPSDFRWQVAHAEPPGTSDTSQVATDHINNAGSINSIADLNDRPKHNERMADGTMREVFNVLKDGADSVGSTCLDDPTAKPGINDTACAALRGYLNIGLCADASTALHDPIYGIQRAQAPFNIKHARQTNMPCNESWTATVARLEGLEAFLRTLGPLHLADADGGNQYLPRDQATLHRGKLVFAENCARCHSSKQPPADYKGTKTEWFQKAVLQDDFLQGNFLSDDERYPISEIGTNAERALATNAEQGQLWQQFSSQSYKTSASVHLSGLANPLLPLLRLPPLTATNGRGYYRTPSLVNVWATAPFLHNNALGLYNGDPSVAGRLAAYNSAMTMLLWPKQRPGLKSIPRTTAKSRFLFEDGSSICIARNTPIDLIANVHVAPRHHTTQNKLADKIRCNITGSGVADGLFLLMDNAPDFVQDRGHTFGAKLPDADKQALMEYMKTF